MLITNGDSMHGTIYEDVSYKALQLKIGDAISFGTFVPPEISMKCELRFPIIWHVIDRKDNKLKLLSYFFFEHMGFWPMDFKTENITWENTKIRHMLNNEIFKDCFTDTEKEAILTTEVKTKTRDSSFIITEDKLFVPSLEDIENIPDHLKPGRGLSRECDDKGAGYMSLLYCFYWLRDPGEYEGRNILVQGYADSQLYLDEIDCYSDEVGVRAVMWVDAEKITQS